MEMLRAKWAEGKFVCVGLDPVVERLPANLFLKGKRSSNEGEIHDALVRFLIDVVLETKDVAAAYKPNLAFYLAYGHMGIKVLEFVCEHINTAAPGVPIILDGKFGDIGKTNEQYARFVFERCAAHAITVNPYAGQEAIDPFLAHKDKGIIVLARTSNQGSGEFQDLFTCKRDPRARPEHMSAEEWLHLLCEDALPFYERVASHVANKWNTAGNCLVVVGATSPLEAAAIRKSVPKLPFLIPGIGTQGGDVEKTVLATRDGKRQGMLINSSSGIIHASTEIDFARVARQKTIALQQAIEQYRLAE